MKFNAVTSHTESSLGSEVITKQELKDYLRLEGFVDADDSTTESLSDFSLDDDLMDLIIAATRELFEQACGLSIVAKTIAAVITNQKGMIELPYGPIGTVSGIVNSDGDAVDSDLITVVGNSWKFLKEPCYTDMVVTYAAGYGNTGCPDLPKALKLDLLRCTAYYYVNRGYKEKVDQFIMSLAKSYKRGSWMV